MSGQIKVVAWDFDGVLNRNVVDGRFIWLDGFEAEFGFSSQDFVQDVFYRDLDAVLTGREDLKVRIQQWADRAGFAPGADAVLDFWFSTDNHLDPEMLDLMDLLRERGLRQVLVTNNEPYRTAHIEQELGFGDRVEKIFAAGRMGIAKPHLDFYGAVTQSLGVERSSVLMIDDLRENVDAAVEFGWAGRHFVPQTRSEVLALLRDELRRP